MAGRGPQYLVDRRGKKKGVLLGIKEYEEIIRRVEDLEDALDLDEAISTSDSFRDYKEIRRELKSENRF